VVDIENCSYVQKCHDTDCRRFRSAEVDLDPSLCLKTKPWYERKDCEDDEREVDLDPSLCLKTKSWYERKDCEDDERGLEELLAELHDDLDDQNHLLNKSDSTEPLNLCYSGVKVEPEEIQEVRVDSRCSAPPDTENLTDEKLGNDTIITPITKKIPPVNQDIPFGNRPITRNLPPWRNRRNKPGTLNLPFIKPKPSVLLGTNEAQAYVRPIGFHMEHSVLKLKEGKQCIGRSSKLLDTCDFEWESHVAAVLSAPYKIPGAGQVVNKPPKRRRLL